MRKDEEYSSSFSAEYHVSSEPRSPAEEQWSAWEYGGAEKRNRREGPRAKTAEADKKAKRKRENTTKLLMKMAAVVAAVTVAHDALGSSLLSESPPDDLSGWELEEWLHHHEEEHHHSDSSHDDVEGYKTMLYLRGSGEYYKIDKFGSAAKTAMKSWLANNGGDPDTLEFIEMRDDWEPDFTKRDPDGTTTTTYRHIQCVYYEADMEKGGKPKPTEPAEDPTGATEAPIETTKEAVGNPQNVFPELINPWPNGYESEKWTNTWTTYHMDTGEYSNQIPLLSWNEIINGADQKYLEQGLFYLQPGLEYLILETDSGQRVLHAGRNQQGFAGKPVYADDTIRYDKETNTLILNGFTEPSTLLSANLMGNSFTIEVHGENTLGGITMWGWAFGGSLTISGDGSLAVNENKAYGSGITLYGEDSDSVLMIDSGVAVEVYAGESGWQTAISWLEVKREDPIFYKPDVLFEAAYDSGGAITKARWYGNR